MTTTTERDNQIATAPEAPLNLASSSSLGGRQSMDPAAASASRKYGLSLNDRAQMLHTFSRCVLTFYADVHQLMANESFEALCDEAHRCWSQLQFFKTCQLSPQSRNGAHFLSLDEIINHGDLDLENDQQRALLHAIQNSNAATFAHMAFQLPTSGKTLSDTSGTATPDHWPIRSAQELIEAQLAFWKCVVPLIESTIFCFQNAVEAYIALCRQVAIHQILIGPKTLPSQAKIREIVKKSFASDPLAAMLSSHGFSESSEDGVRAENMLESYEELARAAMDQLLSKVKDPADALTSYKFSEMASACAAYANAAALRHWNNQNVAVQHAEDTAEQTDSSSRTHANSGRLLGVANPGLELSHDDALRRAEELEAMPSPAQRLSKPTTGLAFGPGMKLRKTDGKDLHPQFPPAEVSRHVHTEFDDGESDVFLEKVVEEERAKKKKKTSKKRRKGAEDEIMKDVAEEREVEGLAEVNDEEEAEQDPNAGLTTRSRQKGKQKAVEPPSDPEPSRRSRRIRGRRGAQSEAEDEDEEGGESNKITTNAEVSDQADQSKQGGSVEKKTSVDKPARKELLLDFEEDLSDGELDRRQVAARQQRDRLKALETERARIDAELSAVRSSSMTSSSTRRIASRTPQPRSTYASSERMLVKEEKERSASQATRYATGGNQYGRIAWTEEETRCLLKCIGDIYETTKSQGEIPNNHASQIYVQILHQHGRHGSQSNVLAHRNNIQLKDKVRNEIRRLRRSNEPEPVWKDAFFPNF